MITTNFRMRRATSQDVMALVDICRDSFPSQFLWKGPRFRARSWWETVILRDCSETWVCLYGDEVSGFCVLIRDMDDWNAHPVPAERSGLTKLLAAAACPGLLLSRCFRRVAGTNGTRVQCPQREALHLPRNNSTWIKLLAVAPQNRHRGIAKQMLQFCEDRTRELDRKALQLFVYAEHAPARSLYIQQGFTCTKHGPKGCVFTKVLE